MSTGIEAEESDTKKSSRRILAWLGLVVVLILLAPKALYWAIPVMTPILLVVVFRFISKRYNHPPRDYMWDFVSGGTALFAVLLAILFTASDAVLKWLGIEVGYNYVRVNLLVTSWIGFLLLLLPAILGNVVYLLVLALRRKKTHFFITLGVTIGITAMWLVFFYTFGVSA